MGLHFSVGKSQGIMPKILEKSGLFAKTINIYFFSEFLLNCICWIHKIKHWKKNAWNGKKVKEEGNLSVRKSENHDISISTVTWRKCLQMLASVGKRVFFYVLQDGTSFSAHRIILAASSDYLRSLLYKHPQKRKFSFQSKLVKCLIH